MAQRDAGVDLGDTLYYGDNLEILQRFVSDETVDLVYLDPPFNKNKAYSLIFRDESGRMSDAQLATLEDYWHWGPTPSQHYEYLTNSEIHGGFVPHGVSDLMGALHSSIRPSPLLAYLVEMAVRLLELRRVLRSTGSLYLHCDPTASHYLKVVLDAVFGPENFRSEITWQRTNVHSDSREWSAVSDRLLYYVKDARAAFTWNPPHFPHSPEHVRSKYQHQDEDGRRYTLSDMTSPNPRPNMMYEWRGFPSPAMGWRYERATMERLDAEGRIWYPASLEKRPRLKRYLDEMPGRLVTNVWTDIAPLNSQARERLGYPTQKPVALLDRIIRASSNPGDLVLDPFCGCGTAIEAAFDAGRQWLGIDISNLAVEVICERMRGRGVEVSVFDWPTELDGVRRMIEAPGGRHRFEAWALTRLNAQPVHDLGVGGPDQGIDGRISFTVPGGRVETILVSVKSGHVGSPAIRDLLGTMHRERAVMGVLFTMQGPTEPMRKEVASSGFYRSPIDGRQYPRLVIHTVRQLIEGHSLPDLPSGQGTQSTLWDVPPVVVPVRLRSTQRLRKSQGQVPLPLAADDASTELRAAYADRASIRRSNPSELRRVDRPSGSNPDPQRR